VPTEEFSAAPSPEDAMERKELSPFAGPMLRQVDAAARALLTKITAAPVAVRTRANDGEDVPPPCAQAHASAPLCSRCGFDRRCYDARRAWRTTATTVVEDRAYEAGWHAALAVQPVEGDRPITVAADACPSRSHSDDGWHCAITGEHVMHLNAARTVGWE
jgi:hypothetical protein